LLANDPQGGIMTDARTRAVTSIEQAREQLDRALAELDEMPAFNPSLVGFIAHALTNYVTVISATTELLQGALKGNPDPEVAMWLDGLAHAANLMHHTISRLLHVSAPSDFALKHDYIDLPLLFSRAAHYYQRIAEPKRVEIVSTAAADVPLAWADRVAVAVVADNLLAYAVKASNRGGTVRIDLVPEGDHVACNIAFGGTGLTLAEQARVRQLANQTSNEPGVRSPEEIGLAVAWEFADLMGGSLWYESIGGGRDDRFLLRLPAYQGV
jgi:signal transduction histidine kinase